MTTGIRALALAWMAVFVVWAHGPGQTSRAIDEAKLPRFEVASVKPHDPSDRQTMMVAQPNGAFVAKNIPLRMLIRSAYNVQDDQVIGGPEWIDSTKFDITAKSMDGVPLTAIGSELQSLLADRFHVSVHHEMRELSVYALVVARSDGTLGPQLRRNICDRETQTRTVDAGRLPWSPCASISNGFGRLTVRAAPIAAMLPFFAPLVHRVVIDRTGLDGNFDIDLQWTPDQLPPRPPGTPADQPLIVNGASIDPNGPSIFTALQEELGLKLTTTKAPVDVLVIDRVARPDPD